MLINISNIFVKYIMDNIYLNKPKSNFIKLLLAWILVSVVNMNQMKSCKHEPNEKL